MSANGDVFNLMDSVCFVPEVKERKDKESKGKDWKEWTAERDSVRARTQPVAPVRDQAYEQMLQLVQRIFLAPVTLAPKKVMFCGVDKSNSSEICTQAARLLAEQTGCRVCLVDADMREYRVCKQFKLDKKKLTFERQVPWQEQCHYDGKNLFVAGTGVLGSSDGGLASSSEMKNRITELADSFEYLLFDAPAANTTSDAALLGQIAGAAILVLDANTTRRVEALKAIERLEMANVHILGTVLQKHRR